MFTSFSQQFYRLCVSREYQLSGGYRDRKIDETPYWLVQGRENASLCFVHVIDCENSDLMWVNAEYATFLSGAEALLTDFRSVMNVYVLVLSSENSRLTTNADREKALKTLLENARPYDGQPVYGVFWQVDLTTGNVVSLEGQPSEMFGLRRMIETAIHEAKATSPETGAEMPTFAEISQRAREESPYKPKSRSAVLAYALAVLNALVLLFMYRDGYANDPLTAMRFGAIVPELVFAGEYYRLFSAMFVHFGAAHFLSNTIGLIIFGTRVEKYYGRACFLSIYLLSGLCGSVFSLFFTRGYAAGASGAIFGLVGAVYAFTKFSKQSMDRLTNYMMLIYIGMGLAIGFMTPNVDNFTHIGGLLMGFVSGAGVMLVKRRRKPADV